METKLRLTRLGDVEATDWSSVLIEGQPKGHYPTTGAARDERDAVAVQSVCLKVILFSCPICIIQQPS